MRCLVCQKLSLKLFQIQTCICSLKKTQVFYISKRYSKANNKYLKYYDPKQESKHIMYLDTYNLYGCVLFKFSPTRRLKWIDLHGFDSNKYSRNSSASYVLKVYFEYPKKLRELHNDCPLAPDKIEVKREMLSKYRLRISDFNNIHTGNVKRLVPNFFDKGKYGLHFENLQLYLRLGLKLKNASSVII